MDIRKKTDNLPIEAVADLELTNQQAENTKAGSTDGINISSFAGQTVRLQSDSTTNQHGTHVAGTVGAVGNNGTGIV